MSPTRQIDVNALVTIDVHVHLEAVNESTDTDAAAKKYFGESGASRDPKALAEYYRSRKMAFVIFAVDERLTGRPRVTNEEVIRFASDNADVAIPFASIDPHRGVEAVRGAKRVVADGLVRGLKLHPPVQQFSPDDKLAYPLYEVFAEARLPVLFTPDTAVPACRAGAEFASNTATPCRSTMSPLISPRCPSSWLIHPSPGRMKPFPSACTSPTSISTCPDGRQNIFHRR